MSAAAPPGGGNLPDIGRLQELADADPGLYYVALHSFVEGFMDGGRDAGPASGRSGRGFADRLAALRRELEERGELTPAAQRIIGVFRASYPAAMERSSRMPAPGPAELAAVTHAFVEWCRLVGFEAGAIRHIRSGLRRWLGPIDQPPSDELTALRGDHRKLAGWIEQLGAGDASSHGRPGPGISADQDADALSRHLMYLQRVTALTRSRRDYARSVLELDPEQRETLDRIGPRGDFVISGPPGSGKTVVLLHALDRELATADQELGVAPAGQVVLLTYTRTLVRFSSFLADILGRHRAEPVISTVDAFLLGRLRAIREDAYIVFASRVEEQFGDLLAAALEHPRLAAEVPGTAALWDLVDGGRHAPEDHPANDELEALVLQLRARMEETGGYSRPVARELLSAGDGSPHEGSLRILVDEAQDLAPEDLALLANLAERGLVVAGDDLQRIYRAGLRFGDVGLNVRGRSRSLRANHRNSAAIWQLAARYIDAPQDLPAVRAYGPPAEVHRLADLQEATVSAARRASFMLRHLGYDPENVAILAGRSDDLPAVVAQLEKLDLPVSSLRSRSFDFARTRGVRVSTMHSAKGLEFPCVILIAAGFSRREDLSVAEQDRMERNLLYVAMTRAMDHLHVLVPDPVRHASIARLLEDDLQADSLG